MEDLTCKPRQTQIQSLITTVDHQLRGPGVLAQLGLSVGRRHYQCQPPFLCCVLCDSYDTFGTARTTARPPHMCHYVTHQLLPAPLH